MKRDGYRWSARVRRPGQRALGAVLKTRDGRRVGNEVEARESFQRLAEAAPDGAYLELVRQPLQDWETVVYIQR